MTDKVFLDPHQLAERWGAGPRIARVANWKVSGKGPRFTKIGGSVLYDIEEVEAWEKRRTAQSTAEYETWED
ncbi:DNA-binding protein [Bradyrhizobium sp. Pear77]|uniref:helix-turn-helix transcriptional regulator n=1 Tax=Bradyrhizobium altum TaxID=1571202 RepID=UPI001E5AB694|nr:DNA-binding protein [Bradyrhizobium altum]MCC8959485.1 DNA-binding protein [Bradyrhizobium altum]